LGNLLEQFGIVYSIKLKSKLMKYENYNKQQVHLPTEGQHIIAQTDEKTITVYQAFNPQISRYAIKNQRFGGNHYSMTRMTWIKPNFMWMMYRAGWATKPNQECILAIKITLDGFREILRQAVHSSFIPEIYGDREHWKTRLANSDVRLQWDPDHNPTGEKLTRKAIQLGLRGEIFHKLNDEWIMEIKDITEFVTEQRENAKGDFSNLQVPFERVVSFEKYPKIIKGIGLSNQ